MSVRKALSGSKGRKRVVEDSGVVGKKKEKETKSKQQEEE